MISCGDYDYIEVACMYRYAIKLSLKNGETVEGVALDTQRNEDRFECIKIRTIDGQATLVVLDDLLKMEASDKNPHFSEVVFK